MSRDSRQQAPERIGRAGAWAASLALLILLAEVVWMVLPFVGYISLHVTMDPFFRFRRRWFRPFFMPSYSPFGAPLALLGLGFFLVGAGQIYSNKLRGGAVVTGGLYRWVRHPQYASLMVLAFGLLLLWPRYYLLLAFVTMCFLYVALARAEERQMMAVDGATYARYFETTSMFFPGDKRILRVQLPRPMSWRGAACGLIWWASSMVAAFLVALGISALTILHRPLAFVQVGDVVALERRVSRPERHAPYQRVAEFFGRQAVERRLRKTERTRETLTTCLTALTGDPKVRFLLSQIERPFTLVAIPFEPEVGLLEREPRLPDASRDVVRVYLLAVAGKGNRPLHPREAFRGYLEAKHVKGVVSALVHVREGVLQAQFSPPTPAFIDQLDNLIDKETF